MPADIYSLVCVFFQLDLIFNKNIDTIAKIKLHFNYINFNFKGI